MQTIDQTAQEGTTARPAAMPVTAIWLLRRTVLWMLFVSIGVAGSCLLYMAASKAEAESVSRDPAAGIQTHRASPTAPAAKGPSSG